MNFEQILDASVELLQRKQRLTYGALKRQFGLDEQGLHDLKQELILGQRVARDEDGAVLVWAGKATVSSADAALVAAPQGAAVTPEPRPQAERRQLTIMFCDLADSTLLSNTLDVEELRDVLRSFQDTAGQVIARHAGFVNSYLGDGILTFFGYPKAQEDDPLNAVRAGLDLVQAVAALRVLPNGGLRVRVGIATGVVVVGDVIGKGASREEAVVGSTSNLAARLQSLALPGQLVVSATTKKLLGRRFNCLDLGPQRLKGFEDPVAAWRVLGERSVEALSFAEDGSGQLMPMIDREVELPVLMACWQTACAGQGRVVTLRGEAGLGKSRLCAKVREAVQAQDPFVLRYHCSKQFQNTALFPVIRHLEHAAGFAEDDSVDAKLDKLTAVLQLGATPEEAAAVMPYFAALLSLPTGERFPPLSDSPERQREVTLQALIEQTYKMARQRPVLVLFEDMHWVDPTTLSLIDLLARGLDSQRVMVLATSRNEFAPPWAELPQALTVELSLLGRFHRAKLVEQQTAGKALPPEILEHVLQKSDGIPLYVEELTKAMLDSGLLREEADRFVLTGPMRAQAVPSSLQDSLLARLDRLSVGKEVAQAGAAIGREFDYETLAALLPLEPAELNASLGKLIESGLIHGRGLPPDAVYTFKHALIQDAAYATMLRPRRQALHTRIAQTLEASPLPARRAPELLAHHLSEANLPDRAVPYLLQAGQQAGAKAAHAEAGKYFNEGLRLVATVADSTLRQRLEMGLQVHLGMSLAATLGFAAPAVEAANQRARELCRELGDNDELFWVLRGLCALYIVRGNLQASQELSDHCVRLGRETQRDAFMVEALVMEGYVQGFSGDSRRARQALDQAVDIYRSTDAGRFAYPTPQDPAVASLTLLAVLSTVHGDADEAAELVADALRTADALKRPFDQAYAHALAAMYEIVRREPERAIGHAKLAMEISTRHGYAGWLAAGAMYLGVAQAELGQAQEAIALLGSTLPAWQQSGSELNSPFVMYGLALGHGAAGQFEQALDTVSQALGHAAAHGEHWYNAELYRLRGEFLLQRAAAAPQAAPVEAALAQAEAAFEAAIDVARSQGARLFELRAAASLARLLLPTPNAPRARQALQEAVQGIQGAHGASASRDFRDALALMEEQPA